MSDEIEYKRDNPDQEETSQWALGGTTSELSTSNVSRISDFRHRPYNLQIIAKKKEDSIRPILKATKEELLCFFRLYVTTIAKTQIISLFDGSVNWFFWYHVQNLIFNSLPHVSVQVFLAAYVPEEHFYLNKMNPLLYGYNFLVIYATFFELMLFVASNMFLMDYFWYGITQKNPWNRCSSSYQYNTTKKNTSYTVYCYNLEDFKKKVVTSVADNLTLYFRNSVYYTKSKRGLEVFQIPQVTHFKLRNQARYMPFQQTSFAIYFIIIWCLTAAHYNQFFKKSIWKILKVTSYAEIAINLAITTHIFLSYNVLDPSLKFVKVIQTERKVREAHENLDIDIISLALNAPPVVHVLISRSTSDSSQIHYKSLSTLLVASGWLYSFFSGLMFKYLKDYCEALLGVKILGSSMSTYAFFYVYSVYFSYFLLGNIYFTITLLVKCITDYYIFIITYECMAEAIIYEWRFVTRTMILASVALMALITFLLVKPFAIIVIFLFTKSIAFLVEVTGIYLLYPLGRVIEDIIFHSGEEPHLLHKWSLRFVPIFVSIKIYYLLRVLMRPVYKELNWCWYAAIAALVVGAIYAMYKYLFVQRKNCISLFCPNSSWGPGDYEIRRCRKKFKQNEYIGSQADRSLSRYMLSKTDSEVCRLDVLYDGRRRPTELSNFLYENEKKFL